MIILLIITSKNVSPNLEACQHDILTAVTECNQRNGKNQKPFNLFVHLKTGINVLWVERSM